VRLGAGRRFDFPACGARSATGTCELRHTAFIFALLQIVSSLISQRAIEMMPWGDIPRELRAMPPEDRRVYNRWLMVNTIIGTLFAPGFMIMAIMAINSVVPPEILEAQRAASHIPP
jgi:hypothetical protein